MARIVLTDVGVVLGGVDLSDHIAASRFRRTSMRLRRPRSVTGAVPVSLDLRTASLSLSFHQDFASGER
jgi:hypothetical protein